MKVELLDYFGGDVNHVNVARVSYGKEASNYTEEQNIKLLNYLVNHGHTSPFRHSTLQFRIKCQIYVERQILKHQVGISVNSISGRYVDFSDTYGRLFVGDWRKQSTSSKQGSSGFIDTDAQFKATEIQNKVIDTCKQAYNDLLELGVSKEQARSVLPLSLETEFIWTGSFLAFIHLCDLRIKPDAQKETRDVVAEMLRLVEHMEHTPFKYSLEAFKQKQK